MIVCRIVILTLTFVGAYMAIKGDTGTSILCFVCATLIEGYILEGKINEKKDR